MSAYTLDPAATEGRIARPFVFLGQSWGNCEPLRRRGAHMQALADAPGQSL